MCRVVMGAVVLNDEVCGKGDWGLGDMDGCDEEGVWLGWK